MSRNINVSSCLRYALKDTYIINTRRFVLSFSFGNRQSLLLKTTCGMFSWDNILASIGNSHLQGVAFACDQRSTNVYYSTTAFYESKSFYYKAWKPPSTVCSQRHKDSAFPLKHHEFKFLHHQLHLTSTIYVKEFRDEKRLLCEQESFEDGSRF